MTPSRRACGRARPISDFWIGDASILRTAAEPYALWPQLGLEHDAGHAFYMGVELARAHHAFLLGKRYQQDEDLDWGAALPTVVDDRATQKSEGSTLTHRLREGTAPRDKP